MARDPYENCNYDIVGWKCTLDTCCLAQSSFNYLPSFGGNLFFAILFALLIIAHGVVGFRRKPMGYAVGSIFGFLLELLGYIGRIMLSKDPFNGMGFWT